MFTIVYNCLKISDKESKRRINDVLPLPKGIFIIMDFFCCVGQFISVEASKVTTLSNRKP